jgi:predicted short-subunit dehydrogenase-like oxidoreductase (DUF2520 family)
MMSAEKFCESKSLPNRKNTKKSIVANYLNIAIIGAGNLAWHLGPELENMGHRVVEVYSRNTKHAKQLQGRLYNAEISTSLDFSESTANVILLCVTDSAIEEVAQEIALPEYAVIAHTSGSQPLSRLGYSATENIGVLYPVQTFTKGKRLDFTGIPILIEAENDWTLDVLSNLANSISKNVYEASGQDRLLIHLTAVFASNFTNYMLVAADEMLNKKNLDLELLRPLIAETINKSLDIGPKLAQTGPARRGDQDTIAKHLSLLQESRFREIYREVTDQILHTKFD